MSFVDTWNALAADWLAFVWRAGLASSAAFIAVWLLWLACRRRASAHAGALLFLLPLVPLAWTPPALASLELESPVRVAPLRELWPSLDETPSRPSTVADAVPAAAVDRGADPTNAPAAESTPEPERAPATAPALPKLAAALSAAWLAGVLLLALRLALAFVATSRLVRSARPIPPDELDPLLARALRDADLARPVRVAESASLESPAVWGVRRPTLLLPAGLAAETGADELRWMVHHELAHVRRADLAVGALVRLARIVWFFHPLVHATARVADELRECACDEAALASCPGGSRKRFAHALLSVVERTSRARRPSLALQAFHRSQSSLQRRIMRLLDPRRSPSRGLSLASVPLLVVGASLSLASAAAVAGEQRAQEHEPAVRAAVDEPDVDAAIERGLAWLVDAQRSNGSWPLGTRGDVTWSGELNEVGVTGLALLNLLESGAGGEDDRGRALRGGLAWLAANQDAQTGSFSERDQVFVPSHMIATIAWMRAQRLDPPRWREVAEKALSFVYYARNPYNAWRYDAPPIGDNDTFVTSLALRALAAARDAGFDVDRRAVVGGLAWIEDMTAPATGRTGYMQPGSPVSRIVGKIEDFPVEYTEMLTAMAIHARLLWGQAPLDVEAIRAGAHLVVRTAPLWDEHRGSIDYYAWLFGSEMLQRLGGYAWEHWRAALVHALVAHQSADGSWPAIDAWSAEGSDVHATALCTLALQVAQR